MNQSEIVTLMENSACIITHKTNPGAHSAMNHVINVATMIARGNRAYQDNLMPTAWLEQLQTSNVTMDDINAFKKRRKDAALHIDDLMVWLLDHYRLEKEFLYGEFLFMDIHGYKHHLTEKQIAEYNQKVLFIDRDMALYPARLEALYTILENTALTPRAALNFTNKLSYWDMLAITLDFTTQQNRMKAEARRQTLLNSSLDLNTILQNIQRNASALKIKPEWISLLATLGFNQSYNSTEVPQKIEYVSPLIKYLNKGYSDWVTCKESTYCLFDQLNTNFRASLIPTMGMGSEVSSYGDEFKSKVAFERLKHFTVATNPQHPIHMLYNLTESIISIQHAHNQTTTIKATCNEILNIIQQNKTQILVTELNIAFALKALPDGYLQIGCEQERAQYATELQQQGIPIKTALMITGRTSLFEARQLSYIFAGRLDYSMVTTSGGINYQELTDVKLQQIMHPVNKYKININIAMESLHSGLNLQANAGEQFSHYHRVETMFKSCSPYASRQTFADGKELIGNITDNILLTSIATMLTICMETKLQKQLKITRITNNETHDEQDNSLQLFGMTMILLGTFLMCIRFKMRAKSNPFMLFNCCKKSEEGKNEEQVRLLDTGVGMQSRSKKNWGV